MNRKPSAIELIGVGCSRTREAARDLIREYLGWIARQAAQLYGLSFDVEAMVASDLGDSKFFPPKRRFYVVQRADEYVGVGGLKQATAAVAELQRMYVRPLARGAGAGRLLLERLIADARDIGYERVRLESLRFLSAAHALYRSAGFVEIAPYAENSMSEYQAEEKLDAYRASALFMELRLDKKNV